MYYESIPVTRLVHQYRSKNTGTWRTCEYWEVSKYLNYGYDTRVLNGGTTKDYLL